MRAGERRCCLIAMTGPERGGGGRCEAGAGGFLVLGFMVWLSGRHARIMTNLKGGEREGYTRGVGSVLWRPATPELPSHRAVPRRGGVSVLGVFVCVCRAATRRQRRFGEGGEEPRARSGAESVWTRRGVSCGRGAASRCVRGRGAPACLELEERLRLGGGAGTRRGHAEHRHRRRAHRRGYVLLHLLHAQPPADSARRDKRSETVEGDGGDSGPAAVGGSTERVRCRHLREVVRQPSRARARPPPPVSRAPWLPRLPPH